MLEIHTNSINVFVLDRDRRPVPGARVQLIDSSGSPCAEATLAGIGTAPIMLTVPDSVDTVKLRALVADLPAREKVFDVKSLNCTFIFDELPTSSWVISLHGIRTRGKWQKELTQDLNEAGFKHDPFDYGFFSFFKFLVPALRDREITAFRDRYTQHIKLKSNRPHLIAHSLGSYIACRAMERYPEIEFDRVILCGSIVQDSYPWQKIMPNRVRCGLNDYGQRDIWSALVSWVVNDAGTSGFKDDAGGFLLQRNHPDFRHSDYFYTLNYQKNWIPFLKGEEPKSIGKADRRPINWRFQLTRAILVLLVLLGLYLLGKKANLFSPTPRDEAFRLYEAGRLAQAGLDRSTKRNSEDLWKSLSLFQSAIDKDPTYGPAYAAKAGTYVLLYEFGGARRTDARRQALQAAEEARRYGSNLAETHAALGNIYDTFDWDWQNAEKEYKQAIALNPNYAMAHNWYSTLLAIQARFPEALLESEKAQKADPDSLISQAAEAWIFIFMRRYDVAIQKLEAIRSVDPAYGPALWRLAIAYELTGKSEKALKLFDLPTLTPSAKATLAYLYAKRGEREKATDVLGEYLRESYPSSYRIAVVYAGLGDSNRAFEYLERARCSRDFLLAYLNVDPTMETLRSDARFKILTRRLGLLGDAQANAFSSCPLE